MTDTTNSLSDVLKAQTGDQMVQGELRQAILEAIGEEEGVVGPASITYPDGTRHEAIVECLVDQSDYDDAENMIIGVVKITVGDKSVRMGYYDDCGSHYTDIVGDDEDISDYRGECERNMT